MASALICGGTASSDSRSESTSSRHDPTAITAAMINKSLNETLSRTILTSLTVFIVVLIMYVFGGAGIHGFAWCLVVGCIAGTYSSIYIASPILVWTTSNKTGSVKA